MHAMLAGQMIENLENVLVEIRTNNGITERKLGGRRRRKRRKRKTRRKFRKKGTKRRRKTRRKRRKRRRTRKR